MCAAEWMRFFSLYYTYNKHKSNFFNSSFSRRNSIFERTMRTWTCRRYYCTEHYRKNEALPWLFERFVSNSFRIARTRRSSSTLLSNLHEKSTLSYISKGEPKSRRGTLTHVQVSRRKSEPRKGTNRTGIEFDWTAVPSEQRVFDVEKSYVVCYTRTCVRWVPLARFNNRDRPRLGTMHVNC